jgi:phytoene synthase
MVFQIQRARGLYDSALPGIVLLAPDARRCAAACAMGYAGILGAIEAIGYDTFGSRARLGTLARATLLWSAWRGPAAGWPARSAAVARQRCDGDSDPEMIGWV